MFYFVCLAFVDIFFNHAFSHYIAAPLYMVCVLYLFSSAVLSLDPSFSNVLQRFYRFIYFPYTQHLRARQRTTEEEKRGQNRKESERILDRDEEILRKKDGFVEMWKWRFLMLLFIYTVDTGLRKNANDSFF